MASLDRPKLRCLQPFRVEREGRPHVGFSDPYGIADPGLIVPIEVYRQVIQRLDGATTLDAIQAGIERATGERITRARLESFVRDLDRAKILDGPAFDAVRAAYHAEPVRPAALAGRVYPAAEHALRAQLSRFFDDHRGAGRPTRTDRSASPRDSSRLRGILSPHIDFHRGGPTYTWAYRELVERCDADLFVILGVAHQPCEHRFVLTRKDFETPLGRARTDRAFVDRIADHAGRHLFEDELAHRDEHSIEFQVVFLQYLLAHRSDLAIVPILVGSFHDFMDDLRDPIESPEVARFIGALHAAEAASPRRVAYIGGIDLGHIGPEFGDPDRLDDRMLDGLRHFDATMLNHAAEGNPGSWFATAARVDNRWRVCGLAATYTMLHAMGPARGRILRYDQAVDASRTCCVSFASVAFEAAGPRASGDDRHAAIVPGGA